MKRFMQSGAILLMAVMSIAIAGCYKRLNNRITGDWHFDKVRIQSGIFSSHNITDEYRDFILSFYDDGTFAQRNTRSGALKNGSWKTDQTTVVNGDNYTTVQTLILSFDDPQHGFPDIHIWNDFNATNKKMTGTENRNGDMYFFTLRK